jgi:hypothetical protein
MAGDAEVPHPSKPDTQTASFPLTALQDCKQKKNYMTINFNTMHISLLLFRTVLFSLYALM